MSSPLVAPAPAPAPAPATGALQLLALCAPFVVAIAAEFVDRLLLPEEGRLDDAEALRACPTSLGVLTTGGSHYSAWDLGAMMGLPHQDGAFILVRPRADDGHPYLALRTGPCLSVAALGTGAVAPLATTLFRSRRGAVSGAFNAARWRGSRDDVAAIGLCLHLPRLWSDAELQHGRAVLGAADVEGA